jgi:hypothetical protein
VLLVYHGLHDIEENTGGHTHKIETNDQSDKSVQAHEQSQHQFAQHGNELIV